MKSAEGSISVAAAAVASAVLTVFLVSMGAAAVMGARTQAQVAADLGALSGAALAPSAMIATADAACLVANEAALFNGFPLRKCWIEDGDIWLVVGRTVKWMGIPFEVTARARAGPADGVR